MSRRFRDKTVKVLQTGGRWGVETLNQPLQVTIHNVMHRLWTKLNDWLKV
jgi:hypothetical protein